MLVLFLPAATFAADAPPTIPLLVYGDVSLYGVTVPAGTIISVSKDSVIVATTTVNSAGKYYFQIPASYTGSLLTYKIGSLVAAEKVCLNPLQYASDRINLIIAATPAPSGGGGDYTAPTISNINAAVSATTAAITWTTNESSLSWLVYGTSTSYGLEAKTTTYNTSHSLILSNLSPATTYHYLVKSKDSAGNIGSYADKSFTTPAPGQLGAEAQKVDSNKDNKIDVLDFNTLMVNWGSTTVGNIADFNSDNKVDIFDFNLLMINWTG
jgi:hypothetical protein